jgi:GABA(A) receptor-associated protein
MISFKDKFSFEQRKNEASSMLRKYPHRYPIIIEKDPNEKRLLNLEKYRYMVPGDFTIGTILNEVRKRLLKKGGISQNEAIFFFINKKIPCTSSLISTIYQENRDNDFYLYITYNGENTFGF